MNALKPMNGPWQVRHDPDDSGLTECWWERPPADGWVTMDPVGPWQRVLGTKANGVAWYRRQLPRIKQKFLDAGGRIWLRFDSVATECTAWVAGREIGGHLGDYVPFELEATQALRDVEGRAELVLRVDQHYAPRPQTGVLTENGHLTKGFHDVLSLQHAGVWGQVYLRRTGDWSIPPGGIWIDADPRDGTVEVRIELRPGHGPAELRVWMEGDERAASFTASSWSVAQTRVDLAPGITTAKARLRVPGAQLWSPWTPNLYTIRVEIGGPQERGNQLWPRLDSASQTFGFRDVRTGGPDNRRILINGEPTLIRGVLEWGHEPDHIAPAPTYEECRERFRELKARGFNCICCCMVYMPPHFYDAADAEGMLVWQEHPVWKSRMGPEHNAEYQRQFEAFFRRDAAHPSVVIVSGSCEHEAFDKDLAAWWWATAADRLPRTLKQVQTAFFAWADPAQTDLYDEHTYDNSGRWVEYVQDVRSAINALPDPRKPFIMGETIISNAWPTREAIEAGRSTPAWRRTKGLDACAAGEDWIQSRHGAESLHRFRRQAHQHGLELRKFQSEVLRMQADNAGWVMNHIRDVPACRCGFVDETGRWRYTAAELTPFLGEVALLLSTPGEIRGFRSGAVVPVRIGVSNFSHEDIASDLRIEAPSLSPGRADTGAVPVMAPRGEAGWADAAGLEVHVPKVDRPTLMSIRASIPSRASNAWRLWAVPRTDVGPCVWADEPAFSAAERAVPFEEKGYSSGWGLPVKTWSARLPEADTLFPGIARVRVGPDLARDRVVITHRLTQAAIEWMVSGGRILLLASHAAGGLRASIAMQWGLLPFVAESGPLVPGDSEWIADLLHHDLTKRYQRAVRTEELGLANVISPIVRYYYTHDSGTPRVLDAVFAARVGAGVLAVSSLDHGEVAGQYLLGRLIEWIRQGASGADTAMPSEMLTPFTVEAESASGQTA